MGSGPGKGTSGLSGPSGGGDGRGSGSGAGNGSGGLNGSLGLRKDNPAPIKHRGNSALPKAENFTMLTGVITKIRRVTGNV